MASDHWRIERIMTIAEITQAEPIAAVQAHSCPQCGKPVTIVSPNWLHIQRNLPATKGEFQIDEHGPDLCLECISKSEMNDDVRRSWIRTATMLRRVRGRLDLPANLLVFHQRGPLVPVKANRQRPVQLDEFFLVLDGLPPATWTYPIETITNPDGRTLHRLFVAQSLTADHIDATIRVVWTGGRSDGGDASSTLEIDRWDKIALRERDELVRLARTARDRVVKTDHTYEDIERQLSAYLHSLTPGTKSNKKAFIASIQPSMSIGTWKNDTRRWGTSWKTMVRNARQNSG